MADVFQEVDDALRKDRMEKLWKLYGRYFIMSVVALVIGVGVAVGYRDWKLGVDMAQTDLIMEALEADDPVMALEALGAEQRPSHRAVSLMLSAAKHVSDGDIKAARGVYAQVSGLADAPAMFKDFALLLRVRADMAHSDADAGLLMADLEPLIADKDGAWRLQALMQKALLQAYGQKDRAAAVETLKQVRGDITVSQGLRQRADQLMHVFTLQIQ